MTEESKEQIEKDKRIVSQQITGKPYAIFWTLLHICFSTTPINLIIF